MPTPRNTLGARSITTPSLVMRDPAEIFDGRNTDPGDMIAAMVAAIELVDAARPSWHSDAACRTSSVDFTSKSTTRQALEVCGRCIVMAECRDWADETGDTSAVLGGEDVAARRLRWKQTGVTPPAPMAGPT